MADKQVEVTEPEIAVPFVRKPAGQRGGAVVCPPYPGMPSETGLTTAVVVPGKGKRKSPTPQPAVPA